MKKYKLIVFLYWLKSILGIPVYLVYNMLLLFGGQLQNQAWVLEMACQRAYIDLVKAQNVYRYGVIHDIHAYIFIWDGITSNARSAFLAFAVDCE